MVAFARAQGRRKPVERANYALNCIRNLNLYVHTDHAILNPAKYFYTNLINLPFLILLMWKLRHKSAPPILET